MHGIELTAPCVLIVSDTPDHSAALRRHVQSLGADIHEIETCAAAIECARHCDIALILLDLQSPMMDGFEAVRLLRAAPRTTHVPVIMISEGRMGLAERQRGQALGAVAFLQRQDLDFDALQEQVRVLLSLHTRANGLQMQIQAFLDEQARLGMVNPQVRALQPSLHRHLLLDMLTGLPNRMFFELHLSGLIRRGARGGRGFALVWIDLDHLKRINDRYQREAGDHMLVTVAQRLESVVRISDVLARIEGDTYGLILDGVTDEPGAQTALAKLLKAVGDPLETSLANGEPLTLIPTLSVGVALYPRHGEDQLSLLTAAEQSAQDVLRMGGDGVRVGRGAEPSKPARR